jgi:hypothetical protein
MILLAVIEFLRRHLKTVVRLSLIILALLIVADALPFLVHKEEAHTRWEQFPGFWAVFGFVGCTLIIFLSKAFGRLGIMQREDYYDE